MRIKSIIYITSFAVFIFSCENKSEKTLDKATIIPQRLLDSNMHKRDFDSLLRVVCQDTSGLDFSEELLANPSFRVIFEHSSAYLENVISFLSKEKFNKKQASVCIFAMQNLPPIDYVDLCRYYLKLYEQKIIDEEMLKTALLPNFLNIKIIPDNFNDSEVVSLLHEIGNTGNISKEFKNEISDILSGKFTRINDETKSAGENK